MNILIHTYALASYAYLLPIAQPSPFFSTVFKPFSILSKSLISVAASASANNIYCPLEYKLPYNVISFASLTYLTAAPLPWFYTYWNPLTTIGWSVVYYPVYFFIRSNVLSFEPSSTITISTFLRLPPVLIYFCKYYKLLINFC